MHILQLSAISLLPAALLAWRLARWLGLACLLLNLCTSWLVHRPRRGPARDAADRADDVAILLWVAYNTFALAQIAHRGPLTATQISLALIAIAGAASTGLLDVWRRRLPWRCPRRNAIHIGMHCSGALGTCALLVCAQTAAP